LALKGHLITISVGSSILLRPTKQRNGYEASSRPRTILIPKTPTLFVPSEAVIYEQLFFKGS
jgi:hypothetical protein